MTLWHLTHRRDLVAILPLIMGLLIVVSPFAIAQTALEKIFRDAARIHTERLTRLKTPVVTQERQLRSVTDIILRQYDFIITVGPGKARSEAVAVYESDRPGVVARQANLDAAVRQLEPKITPAVEFLDGFREFTNLPAWQQLNKLAFDSRVAGEKARSIAHPPPLPDPLPYEPLPPVARGDVRYASSEVQVGMPNKLQVEVKSNYHFTAATAKVEVRVRQGNARIHGTVFQTVTLKPQETKVLTWDFTPTAPGTLRIGARIAD